MCACRKIIRECVVGRKGNSKGKVVPVLWEPDENSPLFPLLQGGASVDCRGWK